MLNGAACVRVQIAMKKRQAIFFVSSLHVGMDRIPFKKPSHLAGLFSYHSAIPPLRKRSCSPRLFAYKRAHNGFGLLPIFCGLRGFKSPFKETKPIFFITPLQFF